MWHIHTKWANAVDKWCPQTYWTQRCHNLPFVKYAVSAQCDKAKQGRMKYACNWGSGVLRNFLKMMARKQHGQDLLYLLLDLTDSIMAAVFHVFLYPSLLVRPAHTGSSYGHVTCFCQRDSNKWHKQKSEKPLAHFLLSLLKPCHCHENMPRPANWRDMRDACRTDKLPQEWPC